MNENFKGILWMSFHSIIVTSLFILGKFLQTQLSALQVVFMYTSCATLIILFIVFLKGINKFKTTKIKWHLLRAFLNVSGYCFFFKSLDSIDFNIATAISFTTPILASIFGILIYKERALIIRWLALAFGFIGVLIILNPNTNTGNFNYHSLYILAAAICWASSDMTTRKIGNNEPLLKQIFYMCLFSAICTSPFIGRIPAEFGYDEIIVLIGLAAAYILHIISISRAIQTANFSIIMPFDYLRMPISATAGIILFNEIIKINVIIGTTLVIMGGLLIIFEQYHLKLQLEKANINN